VSGNENSLSIPSAIKKVLSLTSAVFAQQLLKRKQPQRNRLLESVFRGFGSQWSERDLKGKFFVFSLLALCKVVEDFHLIHSYKGIFALKNSISYQNMSR
jgi:hypothetical protein